MKYTIEIKVDTNDGDYVISNNEISEETLKNLLPLISLIKNFKTYKSTPPDDSVEWTQHHNFPYGECLRTDLGEKSPEELYAHIGADVLEEFIELCPSCEYGFHSITSIRICESTPWKKLL